MVDLLKQLISFLMDIFSVWSGSPKLNISFTKSKKVKK
jgi:hypothetical protein